MAIPKSAYYEQQAEAIRREIRAAEERGDPASAREWIEEFNKAIRNAESEKQRES